MKADNIDEKLYCASPTMGLVCILISIFVRFDIWRKAFFLAVDYFFWQKGEKKSSKNNEAFVDSIKLLLFSPPLSLSTNAVTIV